ncbi:MAG: HEAT repeat domain-containing protein [Candidatus Zipacnadales bacterium]
MKVQRAHLAFLALMVGVVGFVAWALHLFTTPPEPTVAPPPAGSAERVVELIHRAAAGRLANSEVTRETLGALRVIPVEERVTGLLRCLKEKDPVRGAAAYFAAALGETDPRLVSPLKSALEGWAADKAAYALARTQNPQAFAALAEVVQHPDPKQPERATYALWALAMWKGPEGMELLFHVLSFGDPYLGYVATQALAWRDDYAAVRPLIGLLNTLQPVKEPALAGTRAALALGYMEERAAVSHLREASHRLGDWATRERLTIAFALCRIRGVQDDYNFWLLAKAASNDLPPPPYRPQAGPEDTYGCALHLIVQLNDSRVKQALIKASQMAEGDHARSIICAFAAQGLQPVWDDKRGTYVLREMPQAQAPPRPPHELAAPWPFSEAGRPTSRLAQGTP